MTTLEATIRDTIGKGVMAVNRLSGALRPAPAAPHPYLNGIHAPMTEELTLDTLDVTGTIPPRLDGRYLRIGPNPVTPPNPATYHWFVGDGMVHGIRIEGGRAHWYRNRWVRSAAVSEALGEPQAPGPRNGSDTVNTNVIGHAGRIWALVEAGAFPAELDGALGTIAHNPFDGTLSDSFTAHPHRDPATGELHAICYQATDMDHVRHVVVDPQGRVRREEPIAVNHGPSIHDCAITPSNVVILDLPVTFSMKALLGGAQFPYRWNAAHQARVGLLPREGSGADVRWFDVDPCYVFHTANAFEDAQGRTIVDVVVHDRIFDRVVSGPDESRTSLERWTIDPAGTRVERRVLDADGQEFPRCDERLLGQPYRYAYTIAARNDRTDSLINDNRLYKHDLGAGTKQIHDFGPERYPGEFVFIPAAADAGEDEGWLMGLVVDMNAGTTDLVILNAQDFAGPPVATIRLPHRIPPGFHGNWVAA